ncbi:tetratricopeptide repeat protein [Patescibacteria group bacterium]|nr:tetratricopeptide repeat protein [Patescibacteria group bacterium]
MTLEDLLQKADELKLSGRHDEAIKLANQMLLSDPEYVEAYEEIGDNYLSLREYEKSQKALDYAIKLNPNSPNALYLLGFLHSSLGDFQKSVDILERADTLQPHHPEILRCLGWSIFHNGDRKRGLVILERARTIAPTDSLVICDLAVCYLNDRQFARTIDLLEFVLRMEPDNDKAKDCLETAIFFKKEFEKLESE